MRNLIRRWLGLEGIELELAIIKSQQAGLYNLLNKIDGKVSAFGPGLGRIIAKLDPIYGIHEDAKQDESAALGEAVIKRLEAEDKARRHQEGKA